MTLITLAQDAQPLDRFSQIDQAKVERKGLRESMELRHAQAGNQLLEALGYCYVATTTQLFRHEPHTLFKRKCGGTTLITQHSTKGIAQCTDVC
jgi:hypothetical protein